MPIYYCDGRRLKQTIYASTTWLSRNKELVNALNVFPVPDGDTGTNMTLTLQAVLKELNNANSDKLPEVASLLAESSLWAARGCSGVILSQLFRGFADAIGRSERINSTDIARGLGIAAVRAYSAISQPAEGTILTLLREVAESAMTVATQEKDIAKLLTHILEKGDEILVKTKDLLPELKSANVIDAGGKGFLLMIEGVLKLIEGQDIEHAELTEELHTATFIEPPPLTQRFCLDFVVKGDKVKIKEQIANIKKELEREGKDILIAGSGNVVKVHIHTDNTENIIELARKYGTVQAIKIDDIEAQRIEFVATSRKIGLIAVACGEGLKQIFENLNASVVEGGQTMNPSVADLKSAIDRINAEKVLLLTNNANIIPAAKQAAELSGKEVFVVPTKTIPEGISAITAFDIGRDVKENIKRMESAINAVKTGELTRAVRDAEFGEAKIKAGEYIGIYDNKVICRGEVTSPLPVLLSLIKEMVDEEDSIISIYHSDKDENVNQLYSTLEAAFPDLDIEIYYGGQPHYDYIVGVE